MPLTDRGGWLGVTELPLPAGLSHVQAHQLLEHGVQLGLVQRRNDDDGPRYRLWAARDIDEAAIDAMLFDDEDQQESE